MTIVTWTNYYMWWWIGLLVPFGDSFKRLKVALFVIRDFFYKIHEAILYLDVFGTVVPQNREQVWFTWYGFRMFLVIAVMCLKTGWWFQTCFMFIPKIGEMIPFDEHIFQMGGSTTNYCRNPSKWPLFWLEKTLFWRVQPCSTRQNLFIFVFQAFPIRVSEARPGLSNWRGSWIRFMKRWVQSTWRSAKLIRSKLAKANIAPENRPPQQESSIPTIHFQGLC